MNYYSMDLMAEKAFLTFRISQTILYFFLLPPPPFYPFFSFPQAL